MKTILDIVHQALSEPGPGDPATRIAEALTERFAFLKVSYEIDMLELHSERAVGIMRDAYRRRLALQIGEMIMTSPEAFMEETVLTKDFEHVEFTVCVLKPLKKEEGQ